MDLSPSFMFGKVMHGRIFPAKNAFSYRTYYLGFSLDRMDELNHGFRLGVNRAALMSFYSKDHGTRDGSDLRTWIDEILFQHEVQNIKTVLLFTMPRIMGYVFNPVSFWFCYDRDDVLKAVLCEVNNTFGEAHSYLCVVPAGQADEWIEAEKVFHVSPFLPREGHYRFKFNLNAKTFGVQIDHYAIEGKKQLVTTLVGVLRGVDNQSWIKAFFGYPLVTVSTIILIHWQAARLLFKKQKFYSKPSQSSPQVTKSRIVNKL